MKVLITNLAAVLFLTSVLAQSPQKMSYQAIIRDSGNNLVTNHTIGMKITILQNTTPVYSEMQTPTSNANGLVTIEIGGEAGFGEIDWANGPFFIQTETDPTGGTNYTITGTSQFLSVPYALHARAAENITGVLPETDPVFTVSVASHITDSDTVYWNNKLDEEIDGSVTNELQLLSISNDTIFLTQGGYVKLPILDAYKSYVSLISQSGSSDPTATVLYNTLGITISWVRTAVGKYAGTITPPIDFENAVFFITAPHSKMGFTAEFEIPSFISIQAIWGVNAFHDDFNNVPFEIRVYNSNSFKD